MSAPGFRQYIRADLAGPAPVVSEDEDDMSPVAEDIGGLKEAVRNLKELYATQKQDNERQKADNAKLAEELADFKAEIKDMISQIKGGSRVLFFLGTLISGGTGAAMMKLLPLLFAAK